MVILSDETGHTPQSHFINFKSAFCFFPRKWALSLQPYPPSCWLSMLSFISDCPQMATLIWNLTKSSRAATSALQGDSFVQGPFGNNAFQSTETTTSFLLVFSVCRNLFLKSYLVYQEKNLHPAKWCNVCSRTLS